MALKIRLGARLSPKRSSDHLIGNSFHSLTTTGNNTILFLMKESYPSVLTPDSKAFNPLDIAYQTEEIIYKEKARKYTHFYCTGVYGGISTGYTVGCCLRCVFCWVDWSRDFPFQEGDFYSPQQVFHNLAGNARLDFAII